MLDNQHLSFFLICYNSLFIVTVMTQASSFMSVTSQCSCDILQGKHLPSTSLLLFHDNDSAQTSHLTEI